MRHIRSVKVATALMVLSVAWPHAVLRAQDLFAEVFGTNQAQVVFVPVLRSGVLLAEVTAEVANGEVRVALDELIAAVGDIVNATTLEALRSQLQATGPTFVPIIELGATGISLTFNEQRVELSLSIAPDRLREQILNESRAGELENVQDPARWSGYLNLRSRVLLSTGGLGSTIAGPSFLQAELEPVINVSGWVAEASVGVSTGDEPLTLNAARVVWDRVDAQIRLEFGTPRFATGGRFAPADLWGVSVSRREDLLPANPLFAAGRLGFVVPTRSRVRIDLNGRPFQTYTLNAGPHTVLDVPLGRGTNLVEIVATDGPNGAGETTIAEQQVHFAPGLLVRGRHTYSYAAGVLRREPWRPYVSGVHSFGLADAVTIGGAAAATLDHFGIAASTRAATPAGVTNASVALTGPDGLGFAAELSHVVSVLPMSLPPTIEVVLAGRNAAYLNVVDGVRSGAGVEAGVSYSQRLPAGATASLGFVQRWDLEDTSRSETGLRLAGSVQSAAGLSLSVQIGPRFSGGRTSWQGSVFLRVSEPNSRVATTAGHDVVGGPARVTVSSIPQQPLDTVRWTASYQGVDLRPGQPQILDGTIAWEGYRFSASGGPAIRSTIGDSGVEARLSASFASALAFVDGTLAVSRPIEDSFVIVRPQPLVADFAIPVRGSGGGIAAIVAGSPAVVSGIQSYRGVTLQLDGANLPDGYSVGATRYGFRPGYRSGYLIEVGDAAAVFIQGRLVDFDGVPIALQAGELIAPDGTATLFFTNSDGAFEATDLATGEYRLTLLQYPSAETLFAIPPDAVGRYDLEDVVFLIEEVE